MLAAASRRSLFVLALGAVTCALAFEQWRLVGDLRVDDAYITFSFSRNLAHGRGLVYAHGLVVEGYSNFLWVLVGALAELATPGDIYVGVRAAGWIALGLLCAGTYRLTRVGAGRAAAALAVLATISCTDLVRATQSGLETVPFLAALALAFSAYLHEDPHDRRLSALWFVPAALLRIDGFLPLLYVLAFEAVSSLRERRFAPGAFARWALPALAPVTLYWVWRARHYGLPLPAPYYAKDMVTFGAPHRGLGYVVDGLCDLGWLPAGLLAVFAVGRRMSRPALFLGGFLVAHLCYVGHVGGDWMPFNRFLLPALPCVVVLLAFGIEDALRATRGDPWISRAAAAVVLAGSVGYFALCEDGHWANSAQETAKRDNARFVADHTRSLLDAAPFVAAMQRRPGERVATDYGGVFAYFGDASIIEAWGLCNARIAREGDTSGINPIYGKTCVACYRELDPDYFHTMVPLLRAPDAFASHGDVINAVFQGAALDPVIDLQKRYVTGRVREVASGRTLFFLEKRRAGIALEPRTSGAFTIDHPFAAP